MAAKFIPKLKRKSNTQPQDEFFVHDKNIVAVKQFREKFEQMYQVKVRYEKKVKAEDGQWLVLEGEPVDRRNAKNYIAALCHPNEIKRVQFPKAAWSQFSDPDALENIEKKTNAVIKPLSEVAKFEISGTELAVTLAMSLMEDLIGSIEEEGMGTSESVDPDESNQDVITISPATRKGSDRLSDVLQRALSEHSDGVCSVQDYNHAPDSIKRVLVNCLQDPEEFDNIDDDMLFSGENSGEKSHLRLIGADVEEDGDTASASNTDSKPVLSPGVGKLTDKMTEAAISSSESSGLASKQIEYLRNFGLSVGYSEEEVKKALDFVDEKTRPSDFLDYLGSIKDGQDKTDVKAEMESASDDDVVVVETLESDDDDVVILETETIEVDDNGVQSKVIEINDDAGAKAGRKDSVNANLPKGYKERLMQDFFQEDDNCSVDDLKRRNAERQKLLKQNFQPSTSKPQKDEKQQTAGSSKQKGKNKKKKQAKAQNIPQAANKPESHDLPHDKQFKLDAGDNRSSSVDADQTCKLRIWNDGRDQASSAPSAMGFNPIPTSMSPNRKKSDWTQAGQKQTGPSFQQHDQTPWQKVGHGGKRYDGSPNRGQFRKPMQIVNPVNNPVPQQPPVFPVPSDDLRYIVLDGSNVAMTHGNGKCFSCKGLRLCVDYFKQRGHQQITVFVPQWRNYQPSHDNQILDQNILYELKDEGNLVFTPSRRIGRKLVAAYDDRFVLELAEGEDGIIVSNDQYRDLMHEKANWKKLIEERLLMFSFVGDRFMPPADPLGRDGPTLDVFLRKTKPAYQAQPRPKYWPNQYPGADPRQQGYQRLRAQGQFNNQPNFNRQGQQGQGQRFRTPVQQQYYQPASTSQYDDGQEMDIKSHSPGPQRGYPGSPRGQGNQNQHGQGQNQGNFGFKGQGQGQGQGQCGRFGRSEEETKQLYGELRVIFPEDDQAGHIKKVLENHQDEKDINKLTNYCMSVLF